MTKLRTSIFALLSTCLALAPTAYAADGPASETAIVKASKSHAGSVQATAQFQKSQSHQAADSLIKAIEAAQPAPETIQPAAGPDLFKAVASAPAAPQQTFTVQNELIKAPAARANQAKTAASRPASATFRVFPAYNQ